MIIEDKITAFVVNESKLEGKVKSALLEANVKNYDFTTAKIVDVIVIEKGGEGGGEEVVTVIPFTQNDLTNGQLIKLHGLNRRVVSVTLTNPSGLEFEARVNNLNDNTRVLIDLTRFEPLQGTWFLTIR